MAASDAAPCLGNHARYADGASPPTIRLVFELSGVLLMIVSYRSRGMPIFWHQVRGKM